MQERRRHPRLSVNIPVVLRHDGRLIPALLYNMSSGGALVEASTTDIRPESPVEVLFDLDAEHRDLSLRAHIVRWEHSAAQRIGLRFSNPFCPAYRSLQRYIDQHL